MNAPARTHLREVRLAGLGVIDDAVLDLSDRLTVITGETGAGKTMLLTGLGLLLGERADPATVRPGTAATLVEGLLAHPPAEVRALVDEAGGGVEDDELLLSRQVTGAGRSRAFVGGRSVPVGVLADVGRHVVTVHGQADQRRLRSPVAQREALDRYAGQAVAAPLTAYRDAYRRWRQVTAELDDVTGQADLRARRAGELRAALADIDRLAVQPGEDAALRAEADRLAHATSLREAVEAAHAALSGDGDDPTGGPGDAVSALAAAARALDHASAHDPRLGEWAARVDEARYQVADLAGELASYAAGLDADPDRLAAVEARRAELSGLVRRYGETARAAATEWAAGAEGSPVRAGLDLVLAWAARAADELADLQATAGRVHQLRAEQDELRGRLDRLATEVSAARRSAASELAAAVDAELHALAMPGARLVVGVEQADSPDGLDVDGRRLTFGPDGVDEVTFQLAAHPGAPLRPLGRAASGGELSRMMLAVEVVLAAVDPVPVFVFDEIDAGVGGRAAREVGRRLARLADHAQVLVVTHLPQVAAFGDQHLVVTKTTDGTITRSGVTPVLGDDRVRELSRMLGGLEDSQAAGAHARELLDLAAQVRAGQDDTAVATPAAARRGGRHRAVAPPR